MPKKAQAMAEFLLTYGWAVLIVLVMVGALAGLAQVGMIKSDQVVPDNCMMNVGLACVDQKVTPDSVTLHMVNGLGKSIFVKNISVGESCTKVFDAEFVVGESMTFVIDGCDNGASGSVLNAEIEMFYHDSGKEFIKRMAGKVTAKIS